MFYAPAWLSYEWSSRFLNLIVIEVAIYFAMLISLMDEWSNLNTMDMDLSAKLIRENVLNHIEYNTSQCQFTDILFSFREKTL